jgi:hypothetical protein
MSFLFPSFLWAFFLLAIPIIIHLFYFRRFKKVYFTNVRFLKEIKEETSSRNRLKNLLVLLARLLALSFLILAFAQPFFPNKMVNAEGKRAISIFIDNSFSMNALSQDVSLIELAKRKAIDIVNAYNNEDQFQILNHDFEGRHQRLVNKEDAIQLIQEINPTPVVRTVSSIVNRQDQLLTREDVKQKLAYIISDFQASICDEMPEQDSTFNLRLLPLQSIQEKNVSIDSCWLESPVPMLNQANRLIIKMTNHGNQESENVRLSLLHEGQSKPLSSFNFKAGESITDTVNININRTGWYEGTLSITDYPIQFDDNYQFVLYLDDQINILSINQNQTNRYLNAAFEGLSYFNLENQRADQIQYSRFGEFDLIILNDLNGLSSGFSGALQNYISSGGNVLLFPGKEADTESFNTLLSACRSNVYQQKSPGEKQVGQINTEEFIFKDVFESLDKQITLPSSNFQYSISNYQNTLSEQILSFRDGSAFISKTPYESGHLYICAAPLDAAVNKLVINAEIFIPMLYKMAISSAVSNNIAYTIGKDNILRVDHEAKGSDQIYEMVTAQTENKMAESFIPSQISAGNKMIIDVGNLIRTSGFYQLRLKDETKNIFAFNYNKLESSLNYLDVTLLAEKYGEQAEIIENKTGLELTRQISTRERGTFLWKYCILLCLGFLGIEQLLLRLWKT